MKLGKISYFFEIKKFFRILTFYFIFTSIGFSTLNLPHLNALLLTLPNEIWINIFKFIDIRGTQKDFYLCKVNKFFLFFYIDAVYQLNLKHPQMISLKHPKTLKELKKRQYKFKFQAHTPILSSFKYTAFKLEHNDFTDSDLELLIENFPNIKILHFQRTEKISNLSVMIPCLKVLIIHNIQLPKNFYFAKNSQLETLMIYNSDLNNLPSLENLKKLKYLGLNNCKNFNPNFSLHRIPHLKSFLLSGCESDPLPSLFSFADNNQLEELEISSYKRNPFPNLNSLKNLKKLEFARCSSFNDFKCFNTMSQLEFFFIERTPFPSEPNFISSLVHLKSLQILGTNIKKMPSLDALKNLKHLLIMECKELNDFSFLSPESLIESLTIKAPNFFQLSHLIHLRNLKNLELIACQGISNLLILEKENFKDLVYLSIDFCQNIKSLSSVGHLKKLEKFSVKGSDLESFDFLKELKKMKILYFFLCKNLKNLSFLNDLEKIQKITLHYCLNADLSTTSKASLIKIE